MNIATRWMTTPRDNSRRPNYSKPSCDIRLTWLHRCSQEERDPSLLGLTIYSSNICGVEAPLPITFGTRAAFGRTFRN